MGEVITIEKKYDDVVNLTGDEDIPGVDFVSNLAYEFKDDVLYNKLKKMGLHKNILTENLTNHLKPEILFSTIECSNLLKISDGTIRGWISELNDYVLPKYQKRYIKLDYKCIYRLRMIQILREENKYTVSALKGITSGEIVEDDPLALNEEVERLTKEIKKIKEEKEKDNENLVLIIKKVTDELAAHKKVLSKIVDSESGKLIIDLDSLVPLLTDSEMIKDLTEKVDTMDVSVKEMNSKLDDTLSKSEIEEIAEAKVKSTWSSYNKTQLQEMRKKQEEEFKSKSFFEKVSYLFKK